MYLSVFTQTQRRARWRASVKFQVTALSQEGSTWVYIALPTVKEVPGKDTEYVNCEHLWALIITIFVDKIQEKITVGLLTWKSSCLIRILKAVISKTSDRHPNCRIILPLWHITFYFVSIWMSNKQDFINTRHV